MNLLTDKNELELNNYIYSFENYIENINDFINQLKENKSEIDNKIFILAKKITSTIFGLYQNDIDCAEISTNEYNYYSTITITINNKLDKYCYLNLFHDECHIYIPKIYLNDYASFVIILYIMLENFQNNNLINYVSNIDNDKKLFYLLKKVLKDDYSLYKNDHKSFFDSKNWQIILNVSNKVLDKKSKLWEYWKTYKFIDDKNEIDIRKNILTTIEKFLKYRIFPIILPKFEDIDLENDNFSYYKSNDYESLEMQYNENSIVFKKMNRDFKLKFRHIEYISNNFVFNFKDRWNELI